MDSRYFQNGFAIFAELIRVFQNKLENFQIYLADGLKVFAFFQLQLGNKVSH